MSRLKKLTVSALYIAMFITILGATAGFSFGAVQIRVANALYALPYLFPFLIVPAGLAVVISNLLFGGLGLPDIIGGFFVAVITTSMVYSVRKFNAPKLMIMLPILVIPALLVPVWLSPMINVPYRILASSIGLGHILPAYLGYILVKILENKLK